MRIAVMLNAQEAEKASKGKEGFFKGHLKKKLIVSRKN